MTNFSPGEQHTLCKRFVEASLWSQVLFHQNDNMLAMVIRIEETFVTLRPIFARKVKLMDLMIKDLPANLLENRGKKYNKDNRGRDRTPQGR